LPSSGNKAPLQATAGGTPGAGSGRGFGVPYSIQPTHTHTTGGFGGLAPAGAGAPAEPQVHKAIDALTSARTAASSTLAQMPDASHASTYASTVSRHSAALGGAGVLSDSTPSTGRVASQPSAQFKSTVSLLFFTFVSCCFGNC
jgi:hypothetical protein